MGHGAEMLVELGLVVLGLGLLAKIANRFRLSPIPLYLIAGLVLGEGGITALSETKGFIEVAADIGVILLLLLLGLEYSAEELVASMKSGIGSGVVDFVLNFTPGVLAGFVLGWGWLAAVVLGGVTFVSSSGVIAKTLADLGRLGNRETPAILSILVMEDLAMAGYLPIVTGLLVGGGIVAASGPVALAIAVAALTMFLAVRFGPLLSRLIGRSNDEVTLLIILGLALAVAGGAEWVNVSAGVGAFIVGIALSGPVAHSARELLAPLRDLFAAVFFVFFGIQTDPSKIPGVFLIAAALAVITAITKFMTGWYAAKKLGVGPRGRFRCGVALTARGEFSIVIAGLAVSAGVEARLAPFAATYVLLLAMIGPLLMRFECRPRWMNFRKSKAVA